MGPGGIVRDPAPRAAAVLAVAERFADEDVGGVRVTASHLAGREGNREIFVHAVRGAEPLAADELRLAAERTLGAHPYFVPVEHTTMAREAIGTGPLLAVEQAAVLATDPVVARETARRHMKRYLDLDNYANNLRRMGWADSDIANGGSDALVDAIVAWGDAAAITKRVDDHLGRGADHVCVRVIRVDVKAPPTQEWKTLAPALPR